MPAGVPAEIKDLVLKAVDDAVAGGFSHRWATSMWHVSDDRVHRWRTRSRELGTVEEWGPIDRSYRKLAHRGSSQWVVGHPWSDLPTGELAHQINEVLCRIRADCHPQPCPITRHVLYMIKAK